MTVMGVWTDLAAYRAAVAELAPLMRSADADEPGILRVVDGRGAWWDRLERLTDTVGVVVDEPQPAPASAHERLRALGIPVVVARRRLRADVVATVVSVTAAHVVVDAWGAPAEAATLLRDAVGWGRVLAGGPLARVAHVATPTADTLALTRDGVGVSVTRARGGAGVGDALTAVALGPRRVEVRTDSAAATIHVEIADAEGRRIAAPRREAAERVALRRLRDAVHAGMRPGDLDELAHDDGILGVE
ncbi:hypothetical protein [Microbacterium sp. RURRCA19A]|uniref:hypothetical protein n=1 Tax=Microbacterium sp. RURRCA19A TaxID=1907391 RepID=UPI000954FC8F|nr:hypothetical protein [Microbacterium sp. RURRCA19A]SIR98488.1 hypothetical protein SAMN05880568_2195 [Microbacterium sp. RURRCA19A]